MTNWNSSGSKYDGDGNYKNWWTPIDRENFDERVQCIKDEYSDFYFEEADKNLNGDLTAGENTADNGGLWEARYGYDWYLKNSSDIYVPGLSDKFTPDQLYYIGYAQIWCAKYKVKYCVFNLFNNLKLGRLRKVDGRQRSSLPWSIPYEWRYPKWRALLCQCFRLQERIPDESREPVPSLVVTLMAHLLVYDFAKQLKSYHLCRNLHFKTSKRYK